MRKPLLLLLLISQTALAQVNLNSGLKAYYPFSGNANDVSGNNNNPTFNNATLAPDRFGTPNSAYLFNGTNNYMQIPNSSSLNSSNQISVCAWVKVNGFYNGTCHGNSIVMKGDGDYLPGDYALRFDDNPYTNSQNCSSPVVDVNHENFYGVNLMAAPPGYAPYIQTGNWYSVVYTSDGTTSKLYVNCELKISGPAAGITFSNSYDLFLGKMNHASFPYWFNGVMDEVRIYDRPLNQDEINVLGGCTNNAIPCNNWLYLPSQPSYVNIGDLDIPGNTITIEANFNTTLNNNGFGDLVSKHLGSSDVNYLLRAYSGEINTSNGYFQAVTNCPVAPNKVYHAAMVYDGSTLKFYRNGFLLAQTAASGNLTLNNWQTWIGYYNPQILSENFIGYINEVRIWNVARTQAQIQAYMNSSLPNPTTQTGLLAYYTFDNLLNKQGNPTWNGTLGGSGSINATSSDCSFYADSCSQNSCNKWLSLPSFQAYVSVGDLDIPGNQITVEATFNRTAPYSNGYNWAGDLVSKHQDPNNINYLLRPNNAEITTSNGYFITPPICDIQPNKTYHVAMVYNGSTLKFYRNGFLMSSVPATGSLFQNNYQTRIGLFEAAAFNTQLVGYMNEVRIWNVAKTQAEIQANMNGSLPNPTTQTGLLAYYTFDNLLNKQGNTAWNGTLGGSASINATNPNCNFQADSCPVNLSISGIINSYTPVLSLSDPCTNRITVEDASAFNTGDTVMIIQMKGAVIDSTNTASFGTITDYKNAGNYEFNFVKSKAGNVIELKNAMTRQYDIPIGKVQLIRVPYYQKVTVTSPLTCLPWDGSKGGVLVLNCVDTVKLNANIDVSGKGFRGGIDPFSNPGSFNCYENQFYYPANPDLASGKGEGIAEVSVSKSFGKAALANGGGGGNSHNSGGGGGSNSSTGGFGGYNFEGSPCDGTVPFDNRGIGGKALTYSNAANKIFLGGGGGAGHTNNPEAFQATGGNGSGIAIINTTKLQSNGNKILANGNNGNLCGNTGTGCHEGMGGGGGGGVVLLNIPNYLDATAVEIKGGNGANMTAAGFLKVGPGGGGGGGKLWITNASLPGTVTVNVTGGSAGVCTAYANDPWGATGGGLASSTFNLVLPLDIIPFKPNIDSVRIKDSVTGCNAFDFKGLAYTNTNPISTWQWYFGDGNTANTQNTTHTYGSSGTYTVKLVVTDINGCKDSLSKDVTATCFLTSISNIINNYTPVLGFDICKNLITVEDASAFNPGDTVVMIQMKGAVIDSTNTAAFGTITNYKNAGNYEFNYVKSKTGNVIELLNTIVRQYDIPTGKVQLIRVPYYQSADVVATLTCPPWDGNKGGVLVLNVRDTVNLSANIDASGKGFRGGNSPNTGSTALYCSNNNYYYAAGNLAAAAKGESIYLNGVAIAWGKGSPANGGGGGNGHNSGGGGGSNGSAGGFGGYQLLPCGSAPFDNRGIGGHALTYNTTVNKIFLGGGGGSGHTDNAGGSNMEGGNGGGIVIVRSGYIKANSNKIISNGNNATQCSFAVYSDCHDGSGGGGAGGAILLQNNNYISSTQIEVKGGKGGDLIIYNPPASADKIGPGGGGSGGVVWFNAAANPANTTQALNPGANGVIIPNANDPWGATAGQAGISMYNLNIPVASVLFKPNIDSVRIKDSATLCKTFDFKALGYTNTNPVTSWQWYFGDGGTANTQNTSHTYLNIGTYTVKLIVFDINGCKDSITKNVIVDTAHVVTNADTPICEGSSVQLNATGASTYSWSPATGLNNATIPNPVASPIVTTQYIVTGTAANGCIAKDSVWITVNPAPTITKSADTTICQSGSAQLFVSGGTGYSWSPAATLNNPSIPNPVATPSVNTWYYVTVTGANSCSKTDSVKVSVRSASTFSISPAANVCKNSPSQLSASGGDLYSWTPASTLNNASISNPVATPSATTTYSVQITDTICHNTGNLSTVITVLPAPVVVASSSNDIDCSLPQSQLLATGASTYSWSPATSLNNPNIANPIAIPTVNTQYQVTGTDVSGCTNTASVLVKVSPTNTGAYLMPTGFTPNNDGKNDCYGVKLWGTITQIEFSIYNRWGERIFYSTKVGDCWNGMYKGVPQDPDVFVYMVRAKTTCTPEVFRKGTFALIR